MTRKTEAWATRQTGPRSFSWERVEATIHTAPEAKARPNRASTKRRAPQSPVSDREFSGITYVVAIIVTLIAIFGGKFVGNSEDPAPVKTSAVMPTSPVEVRIEVIKPAPAPVPETGEFVGPTITYQQRLESQAAAMTAAYIKALIPLAQVVVSETDRRSEMVFVAWAVRNRVDTRYRKGRSYTGVINAPYQFSAFGAPEIRKRVGSRYTKLGWDDVSKYEDWKHALEISAKVLGFDRANSSHRVSADSTCRHFYAPAAMEPPGAKPAWTYEWHPRMDGQGNLIEDEHGNIKRFRGKEIPADFVVGRVRFYCGIA